MDPMCGEVWIDASCGKVIVGGELVMIVASMIGRNESSNATGIYMGRDGRGK